MRRRGGAGAWLAAAGACAGAALLAALALRAMGRPWWCAGGEPWLWSGDVASRHNSQHLADPYTFTHLSHGLLLAWGLRVVLGARAAGPAGLALGVALEAAWEVVENTPFVIERYRAVTIARGYYGDSVANSLGDVLAMLVAYAGAMRLPVRWIIAAVVAVDVALACWIRDGLLLNVLMLVWPLDAVRAWQAAGG